MIYSLLESVAWQQFELMLARVLSLDVEFQFVRTTRSHSKLKIFRKKYYSSLFFQGQTQQFTFRATTIEVVSFFISIVPFRHHSC